MANRPVECKNRVLRHVTGRKSHLNENGSISGCHESHTFFVKYGTYIHVKTITTVNGNRRVAQPPVTIIPMHNHWRVDGVINQQGDWIETSRTPLKQETTVFTLQYFGGKLKSLYKPTWNDNSLVTMATEAFRDFRRSDPFYGAVGIGEKGVWTGTFRRTQELHYVLTGRWIKGNDKDSIENFYIQSIEEYSYNNN